MNVSLLKVRVEILIGGSMLLFSHSPIDQAHHAAPRSTQIALVLTCLSELSPVSIADLSAGDKVITLVLLYLECPDVVFHKDESEIQISFTVSEMFDFWFSKYFLDLLLFNY
jgi:hypothetical protein